MLECNSFRCVCLSVGCLQGEEWLCLNVGAVFAWVSSVCVFVEHLVNYMMRTRCAQVEMD